MTSEIDSLQERVDAIRATGDADLAGRAWHALSKVLFDFTRERTGRMGSRVPIVQRMTTEEVHWHICDLIDTRSASITAED